LYFEQNSEPVARSCGDRLEQARARADGLRHHRSKTDAAAASTIAPLRHFFTLVVPITHTRPSLAAHGASEDDVTRMQAA
jgi:hypothetical protein